MIHSNVNCKMESSKLTMAERLAMWKVAKDNAASRTKEQNTQAPAATSNSILQATSLVSPSLISTPSSFLVRQQILKTVDEFCANNENQNMANIMKDNNDLVINNNNKINNKSVAKKERKSLLVRGNGLNETPASEENETKLSPKSVIQKVAISFTSEIDQHNRGGLSALSPSNESYNLSSSPIQHWFKQQQISNASNATAHSPSSPSERTPTYVLNSTVDDVDGYITATENADGSICDFDDSRSSFGSGRFSAISSSSRKNLFLNAEQRCKLPASSNPLPNTRASTGSMKVSGTVKSANSPITTSDTISISIHLRAIENANVEIKMLREEIDTVERQCQVSEDLLKGTKASEAELFNKTLMAKEEIEALTFLNAIQEQKIAELDQNISRDRMEQNEAISSKTRKHKAEIKKMNQDKIEYEERANQMMQQMSEQMAMLQTMAMSRIEDLEKDLLNERRKVESLENEVKSFKINSLLSKRTTRQQAIQELENNEEGEEDDEDENDGNVTETSDTSISEDVDNVEDE